jgi:hypothetical protein
MTPRCSVGLGMTYENTHSSDFQTSSLRLSYVSHQPTLFAGPQGIRTPDLTAVLLGLPACWNPIFTLSALPRHFARLLRWYRTNQCESGTASYHIKPTMCNGP